MSIDGVVDQAVEDFLSGLRWQDIGGAVDDAEHGGDDLADISQLDWDDRIELIDNYVDEHGELNITRSHSARSVLLQIAEQALMTCVIARLRRHVSCVDVMIRRAPASFSPPPGEAMHVLRQEVCDNDVRVYRDDKSGEFRAYTTADVASVMLYFDVTELLEDEMGEDAIIGLAAAAGSEDSDDDVAA